MAEERSVIRTAFDCSLRAPRETDIDTDSAPVEREAKIVAIRPTSCRGGMYT